MIIDAHHHLWTYHKESFPWIDESMSAIRRSFVVQDLHDATQNLGVEGFITIQSQQCIEEHQNLLKLCDRETSIFGVVSWLPLVDPAVEEMLDKCCHYSKMLGLRHVVQDEPDPQFLRRVDFNRGVDLLESRKLCYDLLVFEEQLPQALLFADRHPNQPIIVDHCAKPRLCQDPSQHWRMHIQELSRRENVYCKLSGLFTQAWPELPRADRVDAVIDHVLECFGANRVCFGSDWPVQILGCDYDIWLNTVRKKLTQSEQDAIFRNNALAFYNISIDRIL